MLIPNFTNQFKRDYKLAIKRGLNINLLDNIMTNLIQEIILPPKNRNHELKGGKYKNQLECHVQPDWLLVYYIDNNVITFARTGTHSDLF